MSDTLSFPVSPEAAGSQPLTNGKGATSVTDSEIKIPLSFTTSGGDGVDVTVSGTFHVLNHDVINAKGEHITSILNTQGMKGTDTLGRSYVVTDQLITTLEFNNREFSESGPFSFRLIGTGSAPNLMVWGNFHETIRPDGTVTAFVDNFRSAIIS